MAEFFVAYYRVSTQKQGKSGLGLEAQRRDVLRYCEGKGKIIAEYTEVESGKKPNRPELEKALGECTEYGATLIIAKLDRLSRNVAFIFGLRDSGAKFICADMPEFNTLSLGIFAAMAQHEREEISNRIKKALAVKKSQGFKLGTNNLTKEGVEKSVQTRKEKARENTNNKQATIHIKMLLEHGYSYSAIARTLNEMGLCTSNGKKFRDVQVRRLALAW